MSEPIQDLLNDAADELAASELPSLAATVRAMARLSAKRLVGLRLTFSDDGAIVGLSAPIRFAAPAPPPKLEWDLLPFGAMRSVVAVLTGGKAKHGESWRSKPRRDHLNAAMRHLVCVLNGEELDDESGLPHAAHAATRLLFALAVKYADVPGTLANTHEPTRLYHRPLLPPAPEA